MAFDRIPIKLDSGAHIPRSKPSARSCSLRARLRRMDSAKVPILTSAPSYFERQHPEARYGKYFSGGSDSREGMYFGMTVGILTVSSVFRIGGLQVGLSSCLYKANAFAHFITAGISSFSTAQNYQRQTTTASPGDT